MCHSKMWDNRKCNSHRKDIEVFLPTQEAAHHNLWGFVLVTCCVGVRPIYDYRSRNAVCEGSNSDFACSGYYLQPVITT